MQVHMIPVQQGMTENEMKGRLRSGWVKVGRQVVQLNNPQLATLDNPVAGPSLAECDIWALFEPTVPLGVVIGGLLQTASIGGHMDSLNLFCKTLFNEDITEMASKLGIEMTEDVGSNIPIGD